MIFLINKLNGPNQVTYLINRSESPSRTQKPQITQNKPKSTPIADSQPIATTSSASGTVRSVTPVSKWLSDGIPSPHTPPCAGCLPKANNREGETGTGKEDGLHPLLYNSILLPPSFPIHVPLPIGRYFEDFIHPSIHPVAESR